MTAPAIFSPGAVGGLPTGVHPQVAAELITSTPRRAWKIVKKCLWEVTLHICHHVDCKFGKCT